jgi:hypothetical protein
MSERDGYVCPVCGWPGLRERPFDHELGHSFEVCPCCFFQFGFDDEHEHVGYAEWRAQWIASGMLWSSREPRPPEGWDPVRQLGNLGDVSAERPGWWRRVLSMLPQGPQSPR